MKRKHNGVNVEKNSDAEKAHFFFNTSNGIFIVDRLCPAVGATLGD